MLACAVLFISFAVQKTELYILPYGKVFLLLPVHLGSDPEMNCRSRILKYFACCLPVTLKFQVENFNSHLLKEDFVYGDIKKFIFILLYIDLLIPFPLIYFS